MTLIEYAQFICKKIGKEDTASLELCKQFLRNRYSMLYDAALWRDATVSVTLPVSDDIILPHEIERVVHVLPHADAVTQEALDVRYLPSIGTEKHPAHEALAMSSSAVSDAHDVRVCGWCDGHVVHETVQIKGKNHVYTEHVYDVIESLARACGSGVLKIEGATTEKALLTLDPDETHRSYTRFVLRNYRGATCYVTGKRRLIPLDHDLDVPVLKNVDNALLAFAEADMLEHARAFEKAQIKVQEGMSHLKSLKELELNQSQNVMQIVPFSSFYEPLW